MTGHDDIDAPHGIDSLTDPGTLRDHDGVDFRAATHDVDADDFEATTDLDSHVAVGVTDDRGVLLMNDGHHGWTLPAFPVGEGEDWLAVARREFASLTGTAVAVDTIERVRRRTYRVPDTDDQTVVWNVVVRATPTDDTLPDDPESRTEGTDVRCFDGIPDGAEGPVATDIERIVNADTPQE